MAVEGDSYCAETDVIRYTQTETTYGAGTVPTEAQVLEFQASRAADLYMIVFGEMGSTALGPASYDNPITPGNSSEEFALNQVLKEANAVGAAMDALAAAGAGEEPARSERVAELGVLYEGWVGRIQKAVEMLVTSLSGASSSASHVSIGEITNPSVISRERDAFEFDQTTEF